MSNWRGAVFLSWAGMRGAVSLAAALALPLETDAGAPFPDKGVDPLPDLFRHPRRNSSARGLTLPIVIRVLGLEEDGVEDREDAKARIHAAEAALARLSSSSTRTVLVRWSGSAVFQFRTDRFRARLDDGDDGAIESRSQDYQRLVRELLDAGQQALVDHAGTG